MKQLKCVICTEKWYVEENDIDKLNSCPFCSSNIREKTIFTTFDSLDKAIYVAFIELGIRIFEKPKQLFSYLLDVAPSLKKDIRIFSKAFSEEYTEYIKVALEQENELAKITINKIKHLMMEDGMSEEWAEKICNQLLGAIVYIKEEESSLTKVEVVDYSIPLKQKKQNDKVTYKEQYKCRICGYIITKKEMPSGGLSCPVCHVDNKWDFELKSENDKATEDNVAVSSVEEVKTETSYGEYVCKVCKYTLNEKKMPVGGMRCPVCYSTKWSWEKSSKL